MIKISEYGFRDGVFNVRTLKTQQKRYKEDMYYSVISSAGVIGTLFVNASAGTTLVIGTQLDAPRRVKVKNENGAGAAVRQKVLSITGYTGQGEYATELLTLGTTDNAVSRSSRAFAKILDAHITSGTRLYGTYGTVKMYMTDEFGVSEYIADRGDGLDVQKIATTEARTVSTPFASATAGKWDQTYQTIKIGDVSAGDRIKIRYLSKFQNRRQTAD